jgi:hypothetical protein
MMRKLIFSCLASLVLYAVLFGLVLDRPLTYGFLTGMIDARLGRANSIAGPKLVLLAGSNSLYSHRCQTIEPILGMPCVNGGAVVGIGLDYLFQRWDATLHPGDIVYMPMEHAQYTRSRATSMLGPDAAILFRHDWPTLAELSPRRWMAALFSFDLRASVMSVIETAISQTTSHDLLATSAGASSAWGDHIGHTEAFAAEYRSILSSIRTYSVTPAQIAAGDGTGEIARFVARMTARGVIAIGGLPTGFDDLPQSDALVAAIAAVYTEHGGWFLALPNRSRYPRVDFFDSPDHLNETAQQAHSVLVARALAELLGRPAQIQALVH